MKKGIEYEFFYLKGELTPYAYSDDKEIRKDFKKSRRMEKFIIKKYFLNSSDLHTLSDNDSGSMLLNYRFMIGDMYIEIPITMNEKLNIEGYGNRITMLDIYMKATPNISIFKKEIQKALTILEYDKACNFDSNKSKYHIFTPDLFIIFMKYYGELVNLLPYKKGID